MITPPNVVWRKSRRSDNGGQNCVEIASAEQAVVVRDSKDPEGGILAFRQSEWSAFAQRIKGGCYDIS
ncbi:protein of unknown function [Thermomonospora echinospora]|uniref:DUF397 domain-containing protein n=1 Tax=Thermomonospora echinospora TaxID=1992 RepID=A0A1H6CAQ8_9ACTN|nr:DUF397 domain-containing protein [Thermomonospora echinospora]SEG70060.1 protein of unknown function [Thermomonospora echinospora]